MCWQLRRVVAVGSHLKSSLLSCRRQFQSWMGHADIKTTVRYLHHKSRVDEARVLSQAFRTAER
jgi:integrase